MRFGYTDVCLAHETGARHPETSDRLLAIKEGLKRHHGVEYVEPPFATAEAIKSVHDGEYVDEVEAFCADGGGEWDPDTVAVEESWDAIRASAGLAVWAAERALAGDDGRQTPFALGRPPGHHATDDDAMGFCFANNVAVAAQQAIEGGADRVAIFDWDVHHGNGTQDIFYERDDVFFVSVHEKGIYPGTGAPNQTGRGAGAGTTLNVPLPAAGGDPEYLAVCDRLLEPALERFDPDLLLVSAGFDAHEHDPISRMRVTTEGYGALTDRVRSIAETVDAGLGFVLEGGYALDVLAESIAMVHETFDGRESVVEDDEPDEEVVSLLKSTKRSHQGLIGP